MDGALTGLISSMNGVVSRYVRSVSAEPTQGCAFLNHQVLNMHSEPMRAGVIENIFFNERFRPHPGNDTGREGSVSAHPLLQGKFNATVRLIRFLVEYEPQRCIKRQGAMPSNPSKTDEIL